MNDLADDITRKRFGDKGNGICNLNHLLNGCAVTLKNVGQCCLSPRYQDPD
jgi:hypothetical protein